MGVLHPLTQAVRFWLLAAPVGCKTLEVRVADNVAAGVSVGEVVGVWGMPAAGAVGEGVPVSVLDWDLLPVGVGEALAEMAPIEVPVPDSVGLGESLGVLLGDGEAVGVAEGV